MTDYCEATCLATQRKWLGRDNVRRLIQVLGEDWPIDGKPGNPTYRQINERAYPNWEQFFQLGSVVRKEKRV